jgi:hypothetical protein
MTSEQRYKIKVYFLIVHLNRWIFIATVNHIYVYLPETRLVTDQSNGKERLSISSCVSLTTINRVLSSEGQCCLTLVLKDTKNK